MCTDYTSQNLCFLEQYLRDGCKSGARWTIGTEIEHIIVHRHTKIAVTYQEPHGIAWLLEQLLVHFPRHFYEKDALLGLSNDDYSITLEPAAQLEISIMPKETLGDIAEIYQGFLRLIKPFLEAKSYELLTIGYQPKSLVDELPMIPKQRYVYMDQYFRSLGGTGRNMMRGTASTQVSIDYSDEEDFIRKYRVASMLMPACKLLSDNTPYFEGQPAPGPLTRTRIWNRVDAQRCGILPGLFRNDFGFHSYAEHLWNLPLIFLPDGERYSYTPDQKVSDLFKYRPLSPKEAEHILSMTFPDVRVKHYLEIRGADSMPFSYVMAYLALIKGIFFHEAVLDHLLAAYCVNEEQIRLSESSLLTHGFDGTIYQQPADQFCKELLFLAYEHLNASEKQYLLPFFQLVEQKQTLASSCHKQFLSERSLL